MKKIIAAIIILVISLSALSCTDKDENEEVKLIPYFELGLYYSIPEEFEGRNLPYGDMTYSNGDAYFFFNAFDKATLGEDMLVSPDISPVEYTETYILFLPFSVPYRYNEETNTTLFEYVYDYDDGVSESEYYRHMILRTEDYLYHVTLSCYEDDAKKYDELFDRIMDSVNVGVFVGQQ